MRTALAISLVAHAFCAMGMSRLGGVGSAQAHTMVEAVSVELVEQFPDSLLPPTAVSDADPASPAGPSSRRSSHHPSSASRPARAHRPVPSEATRPPDQDAASQEGAHAEVANPTQTSAADEPTVTPPGRDLPATPSGIEGPHAAGPVRATVSQTRQPGKVPHWERISQAVQQHVVYPALARRRGLCGRATVTFLVNPEGMVDQLRIVESSGHALLDTAALEAVSRAVPLPPSAEPARIVIPIVFALQ